MKTKITLAVSVFMAVMLLFSYSSWGQYDGTGTFVRIASEGELEDGFYVVTESDEEFAMNNTNTSDYFEVTEVTPSNGEIIDPDQSIVWEIQDDGEGKTIYDYQTEKYVAYTGSGDNEAHAVDDVTDEARWTITYESDVFVFTNNAYPERVLRYNATYPRFSCYSSSYGRNIVLYKMVSVEDAVIDTAEADYDLDNPADVTTEITWNDATQIVSISDGTGDLTEGDDYTITDDDETTATLNILDAYLSGKLTEIDDEVTLAIEFDEGTADITITAIRSTVDYAVINPAEADYDLDNPADVTTGITWNDATQIVSISDATSDLTDGDDYTITNDDGTTATLNILDAYLSGELTEIDDEVTLTIEFDEGGAADFIITAIGTPVYTVTYNANSDNATGEVPTDDTEYEEGEEVTVLGQNTLELEGHTFAGWNTEVDGTGDTYQEGDTFTMGTEDINLYALWEEVANELTIAEIRETEAEDGSSPYEGDLVSTSGVVTADDGEGFFMQDGVGAWNGIYVFTDSEDNPEPGTNVEVSGEVGSNYGVVQITNNPEVTETGTVDIPEPHVVSTGDANSFEWQSHLIKVENAECTDEDHDGYGRAHVDDGSGLLSVDNELYDHSVTEGNTYNITGIGYYSYSEHRIAPRSENDIEEVEVSYELSLTVNPEGGGTVSGEGEYEEGEAVTITASANDGYEFINWTDAAGDEVSTEAEFNYTMPAENVELTANFEEEATSIDPAYSRTLDIYPNPTHGEFYIEAEDMDGSVKVYSLTGKHILERQINQDKINIDISGHPDGIYLIEIKTDAGGVTRKLIKK